MDTQATRTAADNSSQELFALTDEQILDIAPEAPETAPVGQPLLAVQQNSAKAALESAGHDREQPVPRTTDQQGENPAQAGVRALVEPPPWLAAQMQDPWGGEEAREFWDGVQQARSEAAAYRAAIASPEDARALKELYPGGVSEARAAAERARLLDEVDRAYFGAAGNTSEQLSASRAQLAQRMLQEDPAAFREMVEAGIKVLQEAAAPQAHGTKSLASAVADTHDDPASANTSAKTVGAQNAASQPARRGELGNPSANEAHVAAYAAFERATNEDLERSVGAAIERTLKHALPVAQPLLAVHAGSRGQARSSPLQERLATSIRAEVEKALQGDRQLGDQVAQILASRRFDNETRAHVVRLISDRAQQLVPGAAKRVLNEWTQTTLAAHRGFTQRADATLTRAEVPAASVPGSAGDEQGTSRRQDARRGSQQASATNSRPINYRKLSDEQILEM